MERRVSGIGGIFFKAMDPPALAAWYHRHLGIPIEPWGGAVFRWAAGNPGGEGCTVWNAFPMDTSYFSPGGASFMVNFRVENLAELLATLREEGCRVDDRTETSEFGSFGWVLDPENNRVELWQPPPGW